MTTAVSVKKTVPYCRPGEKPNLSRNMDRIEYFFNPIIGNTNAKMKLAKLAYYIMSKSDRDCGGHNLLLTGPASTGKTFFVRAFSKSTMLPTLEAIPSSIKSLNDLFKMLQKTLSKFMLGQNLLHQVSDYMFECPPMIIFIDEAHALSEDIQDRLLKAIETNDRTLVTEDGLVVDCKHVCWIFATTDASKLISPLLSRFTMIELKPYRKCEIAHIVYNNYKGVIPLNVCAMISKFEGRIARKAIAFAKDVLMIKEMYSHLTWKEAVKQVAQDNGIDEHGLHENHLKILKLLAKGPMSKDRLAMTIQLSKDELEKIVLAPILTHADDNPALVTVCSKGYCLTDAGKNALSLRNIPYID